MCFETGTCRSDGPARKLTGGDLSSTLLQPGLRRLTLQLLAMASCSKMHSFVVELSGIIALVSKRWAEEQILGRGSKVPFLFDSRRRVGGKVKH